MRKTINFLKEQDPCDIDVLEMELELFKKKEMDKYKILSYAREIRDLFSLIESNYHLNAEYLIIKAKILLRKFDELENSINVLEGAQKTEYNQTDLKLLSRYYLYSNQHEKAKDIVFNKIGLDNVDELIDYYDFVGDYNSALEIIQKQLNKDP